MKEKFFFDIPVYRLTEERYYEERDAYVDKRMFPGPPQCDEDKKLYFENHPEKKIYHESYIINNYGGAWDYNEVIG